MQAPARLSISTKLQNQTVNMVLPLSTKTAQIFEGAGDSSRRPDGNELAKIYEPLLDRGADLVEFYVEKRTSTLITLAEDKINMVRKGTKRGVGVRVVSGTQTGYAFCESFDLIAIAEAALSAAFIAKERTGSLAASGQPVSGMNPYSVAYFPIESDDAKKAELVRRANSAARDENNAIREISCTYYDEEKEVRVINSAGLCEDDLRSLFGFHVFVMAEGGRSSSTGYATGGGRFHFDYFQTRTPETIAKEAANQALRKKDARACPAGPFPVIIQNGWGGVLIHEAVGHGLEADFNRRGSSVYSGRLGQKVGTDLVTIIDDGTLPNGRGSLNMDDEGTMTQKNILIENGILRNYLYDTFNAGLMKALPTGNGRREDFTQLPMPRMTNTYIAAGTDDPEEMIRAVPNGLYAKTLGGGQVDIISGNFVFEVQEGYWIEDGRITYPVLNANLIGNGPDILNKIVAVGNDLSIETGAGTCGKNGQNIPVGVGQPTIRISAMTVGGTEFK